MTPQIYLVGGAVRDTLLQRPVKDCDYVLVGGTEADIIAKWPSAKRVGKAFPVYLVEGVGEVALARRERKTGPRHQDFAVEFGPEVTLEEDLSRRDFTINAMAIGDDGQVVDPFGGIADLAARRLRHVSDAFADDVLRLYRLARFAAELEFDIDDGTMSICRGLPKHELLALPRDRVRIEFLKALAAQRPDRFINVLRVCDQLDVHFEEIAALANVSAGPPQHHGEGDALVHTCMVLREAAKLSSSVYVRFAALLHDLGKALTPPELLPRHHGHEDGGVTPIEVFCSRLGFGKDYRNAAVLASIEHLNVHRFRERRYVNMVDTVLAADRTVLKAEGLADVAEADALGRTPGRRGDGPALLRDVAGVVRSVEVTTVPGSLVGAEIGLYLRAERGRVVGEYMKRRGVPDDATRENVPRYH
jgi:tRNA nucleotidyltransferase (CCA-adding enzyme)